ncbi:hypothetical protein NKG05_07935 [Oerskovia sp. M15]
MSATDNGPSNHDDDLRRALRDLVDDTSLPGSTPTSTLSADAPAAVGQRRRSPSGDHAVRRRGARRRGDHAPAGVRPEPVAPAELPSPSATPSETPAPTRTFPAGIDATTLACQQPAPTPTGDELPAHLSVGVPDLAVQTSGSVVAPVLMMFDGDARLRYADTATGAYVIAQSGVIVSSSLPAAETTGEATRPRVVGRLGDQRRDGRDVRADKHAARAAPGGCLRGVRAASVPAHGILGPPAGRDLGHGGDRDALRRVARRRSGPVHGHDPARAGPGPPRTEAGHRP